MQAVWLAISFLFVVCRAGAVIAQEAKPQTTTARHLRVVRNVEDDDGDSTKPQNDFPSLLPVLVFDFGDIPPKDVFPLQACEGNCNHDDQCDNGMICFHREENGTAVPGCFGYDEGTNYCVVAIVDDVVLSDLDASQPLIEDQLLLPEQDVGTRTNTTVSPTLTPSALTEPPSSAPSDEIEATTLILTADLELNNASNSTETPVHNSTSSPTGNTTSAPTSFASNASFPTSTPSSNVTAAPTGFPTSASAPTAAPTTNETSVPSSTPSVVPTMLATPAPTTMASTPVPTTLQPTVASPSSNPSGVPSFGPTVPPINVATPTATPVSPTIAPASTAIPTQSAIPSMAPTGSPKIAVPTVQPSVSFSPSTVPRSTPSGALTPAPTLRPTATPTAGPTVLPKRIVSYSGTPPANVFPLQRCEGDCDFDDDCDVGLVCFQKGPREPVPGCLGGSQDESRTDYCVVDPNLTPTPTQAPNTMPTSNPTSGGPASTPSPMPTIATAPTNRPTTNPPSQSIRLVSYGGTPPSAAFPLQRCEGDCDGDSDCENGLVCFQRDPGVAIPGCLNGEQEMSRTDYCILAPTSPTKAPTRMPIVGHPTTEAMRLVGYGGTPPSSAFPLQQCEGDCDIDDDCDENLVCFQRGPGVPIPGCLNGEKEMSRTDFCIPDPGRQMPTIPTPPPNRQPPLPPPSQPPSAPTTFAPVAFPVSRHSKQLKLYWEVGYLWQEEERERQWCMMHDYDGLPGTGQCWYDLETRPCNPEAVYIARCNNDARQKFDIVMIPPHDDNVEVFMIKIPGKTLCLELDDRSIFLRECDTQSQLQHWKTINGGLDGLRFEMVPVSLPTHCVTQAHQPKAGEVVRVYQCEVPRRKDHMTSFWDFYP